MARIFLICPVRGLEPELGKKIGEYVASLESRGHTVHWPPRDTDQRDPIGVRICTDNGLAIFKSDEVHVWYHPESVGSVFDLGMTFMLKEVLGATLTVVVANPEDVKTTDRKSFPNVLLALAAQTPS